MAVKDIKSKEIVKSMFGELFVLASAHTMHTMQIGIRH